MGFQLNGEPRGEVRSFAETCFECLSAGENGPEKEAKYNI